ncbi:cyclin dependent kinase binding protein [Toxoplasma gondii GT1]|uniref:Cyclin dependent kinase binding protein n=2 Tax=Toxoplasma gondii TaxID=5811 RepID=S7UP57_TOXGG|nr:cyclin dependent kinase binding protein [Toxoplasma gondii GT1]KAF4644485.1 cyclin dependent kinase binding protein [Toxoplasma gondii]
MSQPPPHGDEAERLHVTVPFADSRAGRGCPRASLLSSSASSSASSAASDVVFPVFLRPRGEEMETLSVFGDEKRFFTAPFTSSSLSLDPTPPAPEASAPQQDSSSASASSSLSSFLATFFLSANRSASPRSLDAESVSLPRGEDAENVLRHPAVSVHAAAAPASARGPLTPATAETASSPPLRLQAAAPLAPETDSALGSRLSPVVDRSTGDRGQSNAGSSLQSSGEKGGSLGEGVDTAAPHLRGCLDTPPTSSVPLCSSFPSDAPLQCTDIQETPARTPQSLETPLASSLFALSHIAPLATAQLFPLAEEQKDTLGLADSPRPAARAPLAGRCSRCAAASRRSVGAALDTGVCLSCALAFLTSLSLEEKAVGAEAYVGAAVSARPRTETVPTGSGSLGCGVLGSQASASAPGSVGAVVCLSSSETQLLLEEEAAEAAASRQQRLLRGAGDAAQTIEKFLFLLHALEAAEPAARTEDQKQLLKFLRNGEAAPARALLDRVYAETPGRIRVDEETPVESLGVESVRVIVGYQDACVACFSQVRDRPAAREMYVHHAEPRREEQQARSRETWPHLLESIVASLPWVRARNRREKQQETHAQRHRAGYGELESPADSRCLFPRDRDEMGGSRKRHLFAIFRRRETARGRGEDDQQLRGNLRAFSCEKKRPGDARFLPSATASGLRKAMGRGVYTAKKRRKRGVSYAQFLFPSHFSYDPYALDNMRFQQGRHQTVMCMLGASVSIIPYFPPQQLKEELNLQFHKMHPSVHPSMTLSKLRSLKLEMFALIEQEEQLDVSTVACAWVYFERLVQMGAVDKSVRKLFAGACLLLAFKFNQNGEPKLVQRLCSLLKHLDRQRGLPAHALCQAEFTVFGLLGFSLQLSIEHVLPHILHYLESKDTAFEEVYGSPETAFFSA